MYTIAMFYYYIIQKLYPIIEYYIMFEQTKHSYLKKKKKYNKSILSKYFKRYCWVIENNNNNDWHKETYLSLLCYIILTWNFIVCIVL